MFGPSMGLEFEQILVNRSCTSMRVFTLFCRRHGRFPQGFLEFTIQGPTNLIRSSEVSRTFFQGVVHCSDHLSIHRRSDYQECTLTPCCIRTHPHFGRVTSHRPGRGED